jgi:hypothetical protein
MESFDGTDVDAGNQIKIVQTSTAAQCINACVLETGCKSAVRTSTGACYLKRLSTLPINRIKNSSTTRLTLLGCLSPVPESASPPNSTVS